MAIFHCYVSSPEGTSITQPWGYPLKLPSFAEAAAHTIPKLLLGAQLIIKWLIHHVFQQRQQDSSSSHILQEVHAVHGFILQWCRLKEHPCPSLPEAFVDSLHWLYIALLWHLWTSSFGLLTCFDWECNVMQCPCSMPSYHAQGAGNRFRSRSCFVCCRLQAAATPQQFEGPVAPHPNLEHPLFPWPAGWQVKYPPICLLHPSRCCRKWATCSPPFGKTLQENRRAPRRYMYSALPPAAMAWKLLATKGAFEVARNEPFRVVRCPEPLRITSVDVALKKGWAQGYWLYPCHFDALVFTWFECPKPIFKSFNIFYLIFFSSITSCN